MIYILAMVEATDYNNILFIIHAYTSREDAERDQTAKIQARNYEQRHKTVVGLLPHIIIIEVALD